MILPKALVLGLLSTLIAQAVAVPAVENSPGKAVTSSKTSSHPATSKSSSTKSSSHPAISKSSSSKTSSKAATSKSSSSKTSSKAVTSKSSSSKTSSKAVTSKSSSSKTSSHPATSKSSSSKTSSHPAMSKSSSSKTSKSSSNPPTSKASTPVSKSSSSSRTTSSAAITSKQTSQLKSSTTTSSTTSGTNAVTVSGGATITVAPGTVVVGGAGGGTVIVNGVPSKIAAGATATAGSSSDPPATTDPPKTTSPPTSHSSAKTSSTSSTFSTSQKSSSSTHSSTTGSACVPYQYPDNVTAPDDGDTDDGQGDYVKRSPRLTTAALPYRNLEKRRGTYTVFSTKGITCTVAPSVTQPSYPGPVAVTSMEAMAPGASGRNEALFSTAKWWFIARQDCSASPSYTSVGSHALSTAGPNGSPVPVGVPSQNAVSVDHVWELKFLNDFLGSRLGANFDCDDFETVFLAMDSTKPQSRLQSLFNQLPSDTFPDLAGMLVSTNNFKGQTFDGNLMQFKSLFKNPSMLPARLKDLYITFEICNIPEVAALFHNTNTRMYGAFLGIDDTITNGCLTRKANGSPISATFASAFSTYMQQRVAAANTYAWSYVNAAATSFARTATGQPSADLAQFTTSPMWKQANFNYAFDMTVPGAKALNLRDLKKRAAACAVSSRSTSKSTPPASKTSAPGTSSTSSSSTRSAPGPSTTSPVEPCPAIGANPPPIIQCTGGGTFYIENTGNSDIPEYTAMNECSVAATVTFTFANGLVKSLNAPANTVGTAAIDATQADGSCTWSAVFS